MDRLAFVAGGLVEPVWHLAHVSSKHILTERRSVRRLKYTANKESRFPMESSLAVHHSSMTAST